jgi:hypothetical protein
VLEARFCFLPAGRLVFDTARDPGTCHADAAGECRQDDRTLIDRMAAEVRSLPATPANSAGSASAEPPTVLRLWGQPGVSAKAGFAGGGRGSRDPLSVMSSIPAGQHR